MEAAEVRARAAGAGVVGLHVFTGNEGAVGFYEGRGYVRVGVVPGFYGWREGMRLFIGRSSEMPCAAQVQDWMGITEAG